MCTDSTRGSPRPYLAKWSCTLEATPAPYVAVARTAAWGRGATMGNWGLGSPARDVGLIVAELSSNAWTHGSPPAWPGTPIATAKGKVGVGPEYVRKGATALAALRIG